MFGLQEKAIEDETPKVTRRTAPLEIVDLDNEVFRDASAILGYNPAAIINNAIHAALNAIGLLPLKFESVEAYMKFTDRRSEYSWKKTPLNRYKEPVPTFVLSHAIELKKLLPEAEFVVAHLAFNPDPFLLLGYKGREVYIDVWDEPKFEGRRTV